MAAIIVVMYDFDLFAPVQPYQDADVSEQKHSADIDLFAPPVEVPTEQEIISAD